MEVGVLRKTSAVVLGKTLAADLGVFMELGRSLA